MMERKKLLTLLLALAMTLCLAACGGGASGGGDAQEQGGTQEEADGAGQDAGDAGDLGIAGEIATAEPGRLTISTSPDFPPYEFLDDAGETVGIEPEIMALIAEKIGLELQMDEMDFDSALLAVQQGKSDIVMSGVSVTDARKLVMDFTDSYTTAVQVVVVPEGSEVTLDTLGDQSIGTQRGTTGYLYTVDDYGEDHVTAYDTYTTAFQALSNGQIDCIVLDDSVARAYVASYPGLTILDTEYAVEDYAFGVSKGNTALLDAVNAALNELIADGTVQSIIDTYIAE